MAALDSDQFLYGLAVFVSISPSEVFFMPGRPLLGRIGLCSPRWAASAPTAAPEWEVLQPELGPFSTSVMSGRIQEQGLQMLKKGSVTMIIRGDY